MLRRLRERKRTRERDTNRSKRKANAKDTKSSLAVEFCRPTRLPVLSEERGREGEREREREREKERRKEKEGSMSSSRARGRERRERIACEALSLVLLASPRTHSVFCYLERQLFSLNQ